MNVDIPEEVSEESSAYINSYQRTELSIFERDILVANVKRRLNFFRWAESVMRSFIIILVFQATETLRQRKSTT